MDGSLTVMVLIVMSFYGMLNALSTILLKYGIHRIGGLNLDDSASIIKDGIKATIKLLTNFWWLIGGILGICGFLIYFLSLRWFGLSVVKPLAAVSLVFIFFFAAIIFKERLHVSEWLGMAVLITGTILISLAPVTTTTTYNISLLVLIFPLAIALFVIMILVMYKLDIGEKWKNPEFILPIFAGVFLGIGSIYTKGISLGIEESVFATSSVSLLLLLSLVGYGISYALGLMTNQLAFEKGRLSIVTPITGSIVILISLFGAALVYSEEILVTFEGEVNLFSFIKIVGVVLILMSLFLLRREVISDKSFEEINNQLEQLETSEV
ncbi:MAG: EamA family transporter [Candidatus Hodarchaeota archaeon]